MLLVIVPFWTNALVRIYGWRDPADGQRAGERCF